MSHVSGERRDLVNRGGEDGREVLAVVMREPAEQRAAEPVRVPGDTVSADRLGPRDAGAVQQHRSAGNSAGEVLVWPARRTSAGRHADAHSWAPQMSAGDAATLERPR
jgi:hypothetical protein